MGNSPLTSNSENRYEIVLRYQRPQKARDRCGEIFFYVNYKDNCDWATKVQGHAYDGKF